MFEAADQRGQTSGPIISSDSRAASRTHQSPSPSSNAARSRLIGPAEFAEGAHRVRTDVGGGIGQQLDCAVASFLAADAAQRLDGGLSNTRVGIAGELGEPRLDRFVRVLASSVAAD